ncbi:MAG TPA: hypothetical protein VJV05_03870, partial [Pyrinomonadaceae bacterium]|nr:hypothetical protein [Pyrinomonadaceae bacterium]
MTNNRVFLLFILLVLCVTLHAQTLTVRDIMAEPSLAGMRVEGEKLSPDGTKAIFLWNAEGKMPRDLYLVSTSGGSPTKLLSPSDLPPPSRPPEKENKLDYGVTVRDEFVKSRENALGNFEWSPDSKRLVFSYAGDLYTIATDRDLFLEKWPAFESSITRRADLVPNIVQIIKTAGVQETKLFAEI